MKHKNHSISHRMTLTIIGVSSFFAVLTMLVQLIWNYQDSIDNATADIREYSESILPSIAKSLWDVDRSLLSDLLSGLGMMPMVSSVNLESIDGVAMQLGRSVRDSDGSQMLFHYTIEYQDQQIGTLTVGLDTNELYYELWQQLIIIVLGNGLKTLLMIYLILTLVRLLVTSRLSALERFANQINLHSLKKLSVPEAIVANPDEIGHVALSLQAMYQRIRNDLALNKRQQRALQQQQHQLERLVEERTQELNWQSRGNQLLAEISLQFLNMDMLRLDEGLAEVSQKIGGLFDVQRVSIIEFTQGQAQYRSLWASEPNAEQIKGISVENVTLLEQKFAAESILVIEDIEFLKAQSPKEYGVMHSVGICAIAAFAIKNAGHLQGLLSLSTVNRPLNWSAQKNAMLTQFAAALNELLLRAEKERQMLGLQQALVSVNAQLQVMAETDELTGLTNRRPFTQTLEAVLQGKVPAGLLMLDIDYFKRYNDTYGHLEGDSVLKRVAEALMHSGILPQGALLARIGGEEFAIVLERVTPGQLGAIANQLCYQVAELNIPHSGSPMAKVTTSIGGVYLALDTLSGLKMADVLRRADMCLYQAKDKGRNTVVVEINPWG
ncbi:GGDEF domain-containing protein [Shewanella sp. KJ2020]|uniref:sensor domain-containing diguanylate cyclase n=1 Tax=Shewanella sp. KJ2020 TaxID=2919172 RepID=UPI0020A7C907|nr:GGDEF domain-containing protein [Shewanella sp. KJ2020]MCP3129525.1 GGDEF domain-containing protein [Shewanella sp. KJ2020]